MVPLGAVESLWVPLSAEWFGVFRVQNDLLQKFKVLLLDTTGYCALLGVTAAVERSGVCEGRLGGGIPSPSNPSTRQELNFTEVFLRATRQVTRQEPSATRQ